MIVFTIGFIMLEAIAYEVVQREPIVAGDEVGSPLLLVRTGPLYIIMPIRSIRTLTTTE